ncbi:hypothetical protein FQA39_LY13764 [Lamprigera yunnana]|nr:hypothetical protein FQA39_LY13764 [Lamprigera yunnana]
MNALFVLLCTLISVSHQVNFLQMIKDLEDAVDNDAKECYNTLHINREKFDRWLKMDILPEDRQLKCFLNCIFTSLRTIDDSGTSLTRNMTKYLEVDEEKQNYIMNLCEKLKGDDRCDKVFDMVNCLRSVLKLEV